MAGSIWKIYLLENKTRKERYIGVTSRDIPDRLTEHEAGRTATIAHWRWDREQITANKVGWSYEQAKASVRAHAMEADLRTRERVWTTFATGGI
ncbi:MAG: GIY-YIG nuclease family protein [Deltaproteobacteria bacterium]|nr:GIY-YIG nuclease family protein [Deltaproteobacteria bacterium]